MKNFWESLKKIIVSFVKSILEFLGESKIETQPGPEGNVSKQLETQESQRDIARPIDLGLSSTDIPKYRKSKSLLTKPEHILYQALVKANENEFAVFAKVRMGDFVFLANEPQDRKFHVNQVLCKHVDFLFCKNQSLEPVLVVELDDSSHKQYVHTERDEFKNRTFDAIGLPYLRIKIQPEYKFEALRIQIKEKIDGKRSAPNIN